MSKSIDNSRSTKETQNTEPRPRTRLADLAAAKSTSANEQELRTNAAKAALVKSIADKWRKEGHEVQLADEELGIVVIKILPKIPETATTTPSRGTASGSSPVTKKALLGTGTAVKKVGTHPPTLAKPDTNFTKVLGIAMIARQPIAEITADWFATSKQIYLKDAIKTNLEAVKAYLLELKNEHPPSYDELADDAPEVYSIMDPTMSLEAICEKAIKYHDERHESKQKVNQRMKTYRQKWKASKN